MKRKEKISVRHSLLTRLVQCLVSGVRVDEIKKEMEEYERHNKTNIMYRESRNNEIKECLRLVKDLESSKFIN